MVKVSSRVIMGVNVDVLEFEEGTETVEKAAKQSGEPVSRIIKTLLLRAGDEYVIVIVRGDRKVDLDALSRALGKSVSMAKAKEVKQILGVDIGAVTPLSDAIKRFKIIMDPSILENDYVLCGGGAKNTLFRIKVRDLISLLNPELLDVFIQVS